LQTGDLSQQKKRKGRGSLTLSGWESEYFLIGKKGKLKCWGEKADLDWDDGGTHILLLGERDKMRGREGVEKNKDSQVGEGKKGSWVE